MTGKSSFDGTVWSKSVCDGLQSAWVFETINKNNKKEKWQVDGGFKLFCEKKEKIGEQVEENQSQRRTLGISFSKWVLLDPVYKPSTRTKRKEEITEATQSLKRKEEVESQVLICMNWKEGKGERCSDQSGNKCLCIGEERSAVKEEFRKVCF